MPVRGPVGRLPLVLLCYKSRYLWADFPGPLEPIWLTWAHEAPAAELVRSVAAI